MSWFDRFSKKGLYAVTPDNIYNLSNVKTEFNKLNENQKTEFLTEQIQAVGDEGNKLDLLSTVITESGNISTASFYIDKNNYPTYQKQLQTINYMYNNRQTYGGELVRALLDTRVSFIAGEGLSIKANGSVLKFIQNILNYNKMLDGSRLLSLALLGEMQGNDLLRLLWNEKDKNVKFSFFSKWITPYDIEHDKADIEDYKKAVITLDKNKEATPENTLKLKQEEFVYIKLGGSPDRVNDTPPKIANVLTDIENYSRAKYDMRKNNHLYGRITPCFLVENIKEAIALQKKISGTNSVIGRSYAGTAKQVFYLEPSGQGQKVLKEEMTDLMKIISMNMSIPIQLMNYPELMSNRATAENMLEMINSGTVQDRLKYEEALTEAVQKAMIIAMDKGMPGAVNKPDDFELKLSLVSYANLKQIQETWLPLAEADYVSKKTVMSLLPGINPGQEEALLKKEKEERMADMPTVFKEANNQEGNNDDDESEKPVNSNMPSK